MMPANGRMGAPSVEVRLPEIVGLDRVEGELRRLWQDLADDHVAQTGEAVTRACVMNLIVYAAGEAEADRLTTIIGSLTNSHPSRAILLIAEPEARPGADGPQAWVLAHCQLPDASGQQVCCEQISILAEGEQVLQLPFAVTPLLAADLPIVLWWPGDPPLDAEVFRRLCAGTDRVLFDSARFQGPRARMVDLARLAQTQRNPTLGDLNWTRLTAWRELLAQFYDTPDWRPHLDGVDELGLTYTAGPDVAGNPIQAMLLAGWLAGRLGWEPIETSGEGLADDWCCRLRRPGGEVKLSLKSVPAPRQGQAAARAAGQLLIVHLHRRGDAPAHFRLEQSPDPECAVSSVQIGAAEPLRRTVRVGAMDEATMLSAELAMIRRDNSYELALQVAARLVQMGDH